MTNRLMYKQIVGDSGFKTADAFNESDHPRADNGQFGSGGGKAAPKSGGKSESKGKETTVREVLAHPEGKALIQQLEEMGDNPDLQDEKKHVIAQLKKKFNYNAGEPSSKPAAKSESKTPASHVEATKVRRKLSELHEAVRNAETERAKKAAIAEIESLGKSHPDVTKEWRTAQGFKPGQY